MLPEYYYMAAKKLIVLIMILAGCSSSSTNEMTTVSGHTASYVQHEMDHIDEKLIFDYAEGMFWMPKKN